MVTLSKRINIYFTNENDRMKFDDWFVHQLWFCSSEEIFDRIIEHLVIAIIVIAVKKIVLNQYKIIYIQNMTRIKL